MTTISQDFSAVADVNPFTDFVGGSEVSLGNFRANGGVISPAAYYTTAALSMSAVPSAGVMRIDFKSSNSDSMYGDDTVAGFLNASGDGYAAQLDGNRFRLRAFTAWAPSSVYADVITPYVSGEDYFVTLDLDTRELEFYQVSVSDVVPTLSATIAVEDVVEGVRPAIITNWYSSGAGGIIDFTFTADVEIATSIASIDQLIGGSTSTIIFSAAFTPTSLTITDGASGTVSVSSFSGSGTTWTFTCPALTDGVVGPKLGTVGVTATDGTATTASFSSSYVKTGYTAVVITSLGSGNIGVGFSPALAVGNQEAYDATKGTIAADGVFTGTYTGTQTVWDHNVTDFTWRSFTIETVDGVISDTTPDAFTFTDVTNATLSTTYTSNTITVSGIDTSTAISITGGTYSVDGGGYTSSSGTVSNGQTVNVRVTSSGSFSTAVNAVLDIGGVTDTYTVTTQASDNIPDQFTFVDITNATLSTVYTSNAITVTGINTSANIAITGGTYSINGGAYTAVTGTVVNNDVVTVRTTSSSSFNTAVNVLLAISGIADTYRVTTLAAADTTPDAFTFTDITGATPSQVYTSNTITVSGIDAAANISVTGGTYNINGGAYTSSPGTVTNGQTVTTRITSSASSLTPVNSTVTIGGVSDTFTVTTQFVADSTPDAFTFTDVTQQATNSVINSAPITVAGINTSTAISVTGGLYSIDGGAYTASPGTVSNGQLVRAQVTTPWTHSTATSAIVTIGGVSDTFTATTTTTVDTAPTAFTFNDVTGVAQNSTNDSNTITITGINSPAAITVTGGTYSINGGAFTASAGNVSYGDYVVARNIASASLSATTNTVVTIGGVTDTYSVTTSATVISGNRNGQRLGIGIKIGF